MRDEGEASSSSSSSAAALRFARSLNPVAKELLAGGAAGAVAKTAVAPLERAKILFQTGSATGTAGSLSTPRVLGLIVRHEGAAGLWKGNAASVLRVVPYAALHFSAYERYREAFQKLGSGQGAPAWCQSLARTPTVDLLAGSAAGATAVLFTYPLDLIRTRLAWRGSEIAAPATTRATAQARAASLPTPSMAGALSSLARREGVLGLYKGVGPTLLGVFPYAGLKFFVYQYLKKVYLTSPAAATSGGAHARNKRSRSLRDSPYSPSADVPTSVKLVFGASAGLIGQTITYPLDVVRRRMQVQDLVREASGSRSSAGGAGSSAPAEGAALPYIKNTWHGLRLIAKLGVRKGLYAGLSINYLKVIPSTAIGFAVYDTLKDVLRHKTSI